MYSTYDESGSEEIVMDILNNLFLFKLNWILAPEHTALASSFNFKVVPQNIN